MDGVIYILCLLLLLRSIISSNFILLIDLHSLLDSLLLYMDANRSCNDCIGEIGQCSTKIKQIYGFRYLVGNILPAHHHWDHCVSENFQNRKILEELPIGKYWRKSGGDELWRSLENCQKRGYWDLFLLYHSLYSFSRDIFWILCKFTLTNSLLFVH